MADGIIPAYRRFRTWALEFDETPQEGNEVCKVEKNTTINKTMYMCLWIPKNYYLLKKIENEKKQGEYTLLPAVSQYMIRTEQRVNFHYMIVRYDTMKLLSFKKARTLLKQKTIDNIF